MAKILSNNPFRRSNNWAGKTPRGRRTVPLQLPKLSVRRLLKRDPAKGTSQPAYDNYTETLGVKGLSGASSVKTLARDRSAPPNAGKNTVKNKGVNRKLNKR
jgi:histone H3/H4